LLYLKGFLQYWRDWLRLGKDKPLPEVNLSGKLHEPPSDLLPPAVECLLAGKKQVTSKSVVSLIINLVNKKVIKIEAKKLHGVNLLGWAKGNYEYKLVRRESMRACGGVSLHSIEQDLLEFLFEKCGKGEKEVSFEQIKKYARTHKTTSYSFFQDFGKAGFEHCLDEGLFDRQSHKFAKKFGNISLWLGFGLNFVLLFGIIFLMSIAPAAIAVIPLVMIFFIIEMIGIVFLIILLSTAEKRTDKGRKRSGWLAGL